MPETKEWRRRIAASPRLLGGKPLIRGTRVPVSVVIGALGCGMSVPEVCRAYRLTREDVEAARAYADETWSERPVIVLPRGVRARLGRLGSRRP